MIEALLGHREALQTKLINKELKWNYNTRKYCYTLKIETAYVAKNKLHMWQGRQLK